MQEINLLQSKVRDTTSAWQRQSNIVIGLLATILLIVIIGGVVLFFLSQNLDKHAETVTVENTNLQKQISQKTQGLDKAQIFQAQLANVSTLLKGHMYSSALLDEIDKITYKKSQYFSMGLGTDNVLHLEGRTLSYTDLGKFLLGLNSSRQFTDVKLTSTSPGVDNGYEFSVQAKVSPSIYLKQ